MQVQAHGFNDALPGGRSSGQLSIGPAGVRFSSQGSVADLPLDGLQVSAGGANERLIFFRHPSHPDWSIYTSDRQVLAAPELTEHPQIVLQLKALHRRKTGRWIVAALVLLGLLATPVLLYKSMGGLSALAARSVPLEWEESLGELAVEDYHHSHEVLKDGAAVEHLDRLTAHLVAELEDSPYDFELWISDDPSVNAFAVPGGIIVVHAGLILKAESAEELLGVLSHELAHVTEQHGLRMMINSVGLFLVLQAVVGDMGGLLGSLAQAAPFLLSQQYSQGFESDADQRGVDLMRAADIDPRGLVLFFERLLEEERELRAEAGSDALADAMEGALEFLSSHPATDERINEINAMIEEDSGVYRDLASEFRVLQDEVRAWSSATPSTSGDSDES